MKTKLIAGGALAAAAVLYVGSSYFLGKQAESTLTHQYEMLQNNGLLTVDSRQYDRGWFGATETTVIRIKPTLLQNIQSYLPDNIKAALSEPVTIVNHVRHGPLAGWRPAAADVESEIRYQPATAAVLKRFFGDEVPVRIRNSIGFSGGGRLDIAVPAFNYEELSGIRLTWQGLNGHTAYSKNWKSFSYQYFIPLLQAKLADKGDVVLENIRLSGDTHEGRHAVALGNGSNQVGKFSVSWKEGIDYNVKLSDLIQTVTNLQVGAFINPTGTIAPSHIQVDNISFDSKTEETGTDGSHINSEGRFRFDKLTYGNDQYGPLDIDIAAEHLNAAALQTLKRKMAALAAKPLAEGELQAELLRTVRGEASALFTDNPKITIRRFDFTLPQGKIQAEGGLGFNGLTAADLNDIGPMLQKTEADIRFAVPQKLLEHFAISQARSLFSVNAEDEAAGRAGIEDIDETLRLMVDSNIRSLADQGYLNVSGGNVATRFEVRNNTLKLNGKPFELEPEPDFSDADMAEENAASAP